MITSTLLRAGINDKQYNTHSFRIGAATTAKELGWYLWCSYKNARALEEQCLSVVCSHPRDKLAKLSKQMVTGNGHHETKAIIKDS